MRRYFNYKIYSTGKLTHLLLHLQDRMEGTASLHHHACGLTELFAATHWRLKDCYCELNSSVSMCPPFSMLMSITHIFPSFNGHHQPAENFSLWEGLFVQWAFTTDQIPSKIKWRDLWPSRGKSHPDIFLMCAANKMARYTESPTELVESKDTKILGEKSIDQQGKWRPLVTSMIKDR